MIKDLKLCYKTINDKEHDKIFDWELPSNLPKSNGLYYCHKFHLNETRSRKNKKFNEISSNDHKVVD